MKLALRWIMILIGIVLVMAILYVAYSELVLDYSLNNLEYALSVVDRAPANESPLAQKVYRQLVEDMAFDEAGKEGADVKDLVLLDAASFSLGEAVERAGYQRASVYLAQVMESKLFERSAFLKITDAIYSGLSVFSNTVQSAKKFITKKVFTKKSQIGQVNYSSLLLLTKAEEEQSKGRFQEAADLYRKYLKYYPWNPDSGFVELSLAYILIKMNDYSASEKLLKEIAAKYVGSEEESIASKLIERIQNIKDRKILIGQLNQLIQSSQGTPTEENLKLKVSLAFISTYELKEAEKILNELKNAKDENVRQKAVFYLAWLYKHRQQYDVSMETFMGLLEDPSLNPDLELGTRAQLASLYYIKKDSSSSAKEYEKLVHKVDTQISSLDVAQKAWESLEESRKTIVFKGWKSVGELEQASINAFDLGNPTKAEQNLNQLQQVAPRHIDFSEVSQEVLEGSEFSLRDRAFDALRKGRVHAAFEMFQRNADLFPRDGWTLSGLGTVYLLLAEIEFAHKYVAQGYRFKPDEYTAAALAYVKSFLNDYESALGFYGESIGYNNKYIPARFNIACIYLEIKQFAKALKELEMLNQDSGARHRYLKAKILNNMGYALWHLGQKDQAKAKFREAIESTPDFILGKMNLKQIDENEPPAMVNAEEV